MKLHIHKVTIIFFVILTLPSLYTTFPGRPPMHVLLIKGAQFPLQELAPFWKDFASKLGLPKDSVKTIEENFKEEEERLKTVFSKWHNNDQYQSKYPCTWKGLGNLLEDCNKQKEAAKLFEIFLV